VAEGYEIRPMRDGDAPAFALAYRRNRAHLEPWDPDRPEFFWTDEGQVENVASGLRAAEEGRTYTYVVWYGEQVVGRAMLTNIVRGPLQSGTVGYWVDHEHTGKGLATALTEHVALDAVRLGLHRLEAGTMVENVASQMVLRRAGFTEYGTAERFLYVRGEWRDHVLFQRILHNDPPGNPGA
jgi:[ribosomal protein S5]-alanine N-acetyltransferase